MAVNEKPIFVTENVSGEGNRLPYRPGDRIDERLRPEVVRSLQERGLATDDGNAAKRARGQDDDHRAHVQEQIASRSEKRGE